jgi:tetratricopeptide (TPR) repeat protein
MTIHVPPPSLIPRKGIDELQDQLRRNPRDAMAMAELGRYSWQADDFDRALEYLQEAVRIDGHSDYCRTMLGRLFAAKGNIGEARSCFEECVGVCPESPLAHMSLGDFCLDKLGAYRDAEGYFFRAQQLDPTLDRAYSRFCACLIQGLTLDEALAKLRRCVARNSMNAVRAYAGLQCALAEYGRYFEARACNEELLRLYPYATAALDNMALLSLAMRDIDRAMYYAEEGMRREPHNAGHIKRYLRVLLSQSLYGRARDHFERHRGQFPVWKFHNETWTGEPLAGKTIVLNAHSGYGDAIQSVGFADLLKREGATVIARCRTPLMRALRTVPFVDCVVPSEYSSPKADYEALTDHVAWNRPISEDWIGSIVPYFFVPAEVQTFWAARVHRERTLKVGIRWRGSDSEMHDIYQRRSIPLKALQPLMEIEGISLFGLQKGSGIEELDSFPGAGSITSLGEEFGDFLDLAGALSALDLIVSVDTSVAHFSGALGRPTWILMPFAPLDWRWHVFGDRNDWYPTVRLFRQEEPGEWDDVVSNVVVALRSRLEEASADRLGASAR